MNEIEQTITTVEIAEMMDTSHRNIMRKLEGQETKGKHIKGIIEVLTDANLGVSDYFTSSTYRDASGKENKCYKCTRMGCEFLANKFTGEKGIIFTARYVKRFHEMEQVISQQNITEQEQEKKLPQYTTEEIVDWKLNDLHKRLMALEEEQSQKPKIGKLHRLIPKKDTWYEKNRNRIWRIRYDKDIELKELYHIILDECSRHYDLDEAESIYQNETGHNLTYPIDVVDFFPELQDIANQVLDYYEQ